MRKSHRTLSVLPLAAAIGMASLAMTANAEEGDDADRMVFRHYSADFGSGSGLIWDGSWSGGGGFGGNLGSEGDHTGDDSQVIGPGDGLPDDEATDSFVEITYISDSGDGIEGRAPEDEIVWVSRSMLGTTTEAERWGDEYFWVYFQDGPLFPGEVVTFETSGGATTTYQHSAIPYIKNVYAQEGETYLYGNALRDDPVYVTREGGETLTANRFDNSFDVYFAEPLMGGETVYIETESGLTESVVVESSGATMPPGAPENVVFVADYYGDGYHAITGTIAFDGNRADVLAEDSAGNVIGSTAAQLTGEFVLEPYEIPGDGRIFVYGQNFLGESERTEVVVPGLPAAPTDIALNSTKDGLTGNIQVEGGEITLWVTDEYNTIQASKVITTTGVFDIPLATIDYGRKLIVYTENGLGKSEPVSFVPTTPPKLPTSLSLNYNKDGVVGEIQYLGDAVDVVVEDSLGNILASEAYYPSYNNHSFSSNWFDIVLTDIPYGEDLYVYGMNDTGEGEKGTLVIDAPPETPTQLALTTAEDGLTGQLQFDSDTAEVVITDATGNEIMRQEYTTSGAFSISGDAFPAYGNVVNVYAENASGASAPTEFVIGGGCYLPENAGTVGVEGECLDQYIVADGNELRSIVSSGTAVFDELFTGQVKDFSQVFRGYTNVPTVIGNWQVKHGTNFYRMFEGAVIPSLDLTGWDVSSADNMSGMFMGAQIISLNASGWELSDGYVGLGSLFGGSFTQEGGKIDLSGWQNVDNIAVFADATLATLDLSGWDTTAMPSFKGITMQSGGMLNLSGWGTLPAQSLGAIFEGADLAAMDTTGTDMRNVSSLSWTFKNAVIGTAAARDIEKWNITSSVASMSGVFSGATADALDLRRWKTEGVTDMRSAFQGATIGSLNIPWDTSAVTDMGRMFSGITTDTLDLGSSSEEPVWDTSAVTDMGIMFNNSDIRSLNAAGWNTQQVTSLSSMFSSAKIGSIDLSDWDLRRASSANQLFANATISSPVDLSSWTLNSVVRSSPLGLSRAFSSSEIPSLDLSGWHLVGVDSLSEMFSNSDIGALDVSGWVLAEGAFGEPEKNMDSMFYRSQGGVVTGLGNWNVVNVTRMDDMFRETPNFNTNEPINWTTPKVTDMSNMFRGAASFNQPVTITDTSSVTDMSYMFSGAASFNQPLDFDTSSVTNMSYMFDQAASFNRPLDFDTSSVTDMRYMFRGAASFNQPLDFDTSSVTSMYSMFQNAASFNQPLDFDTSSAPNMGYMFENATSFNQPLDFDTSSVTSMRSMFRGAVKMNANLSCWDVQHRIEQYRVYPEGFSYNTPAWDDANKPRFGEAPNTGCNP